jgi:hypothetical protein
MLRRCFHRFIAILRAGRECGRRVFVLKHKKSRRKPARQQYFIPRQPAEIEKPESTSYLTSTDLTVGSAVAEAVAEAIAEAVAVTVAVTVAVAVASALGRGISTSCVLPRRVARGKAYDWK